MAEPKNDDFLDDIATAEAEELAEDMAEIDPAFHRATCPTLTHAGASRPAG